MNQDSPRDLNRCTGRSAIIRFGSCVHSSLNKSQLHLLTLTECTRSTGSPQDIRSKSIHFSHTRAHAGTTSPYIRPPSTTSRVTCPALSSLFYQPTPAVLHLFVHENNSWMFVNVNDSLSQAEEANPRPRWC